MYESPPHFLQLSVRYPWSLWKKLVSKHLYKAICLNSVLARSEHFELKEATPSSKGSDHKGVNPCKTSVIENVYVTMESKINSGNDHHATGPTSATRVHSDAQTNTLWSVQASGDTWARMKFEWIHNLTEFNTLYVFIHLKNTADIIVLNCT